MTTHDDHKHATDIVSAARIQGLPVETLRKRLQRGRIDGFKAANGTWRVVLDTPGQPAGAVHGALADPQTIDRLFREVEEVRRQAARLTEETHRTTALLEETLSAIAALHTLIESLSRPSAYDPGRANELRPVMMALLDYLQQSKRP